MWRFLWKFVITCLTTLCTLITITQFFLGTSTYSDLAKKYDLPTEISSTLILYFAISILFIILVCQLFAYHRNAKRAKLASEYMHRFHHIIRIELFKMRLQVVNNPPTNPEDFYTSVQSICKGLCDKVHGFLKKKTGKEFSVCIKLLKTSQSIDNTPEENEMCTYTICRSGNDRDTRIGAATRRANDAVSERDVLVPLKENTAFYDLMNNEYNGCAEMPTIFACSNLFMLRVLNTILKKQPYKNPNRDFMKYYLSTIVVPIRIPAEVLLDRVNQDPKYITIGFLCIDRRWPISKALINELIGYSKSFADAFFNLLFEVGRRDQLIREQSFITN